MFSKNINGNNNQKAIDKYNMACNYKSKGDYDTSIKLFNEALSLNPNYADALNNLGNIYNAMEKYNEALEHLSKAVILLPNEPIILNNISICLMELGKLEEAKSCLEKAIRIKPNFFPAYNTLGKLFAMKNDLISAKECFQKSLEIEPSHPKAQLNLDIINDLLNNVTKEHGTEYYTKRKESIKTGINLNLEELLIRAQSYNVSNQFGEAIYLFNEVLKINPRSIEALSGLSSVYLSSCNFERAIEFAKEALSIDSKFKESFYHIGVANHSLGNYESAVNNLSKFISLSETEQDIFDGNYFIGLSYFQLCIYDKSIYHLTKATELDNPFRGGAYFALANSYLAIGNEKNCLVNMKKASSFNNEDAKEWLLLNDLSDSEICF